MKVSVNKITLKIEGEVGKNNTLPIDFFVKLSIALQELIMEIARLDLATEFPIDLNNFKLELSDYRKGSAIPTFSFSPTAQQSITSNVGEQRASVSNKFMDLMAISDKGLYLNLISKYQEPIKRKSITDSLYKFIESLEDTPVSVLDLKGKLRYSIKPFRKEVRDKIVTPIIELKAKEKPQKFIQLAKVEVIDGKKQPKVLELFDKKFNHIEFAPEILIIDDKVYEFKYPLHSTMDVIDGIVKLENQFLGIYAIGNTTDEAEKMFSEEFDYLYTRYNDLPDKKLTQDVKLIKSFLNHIVKK